MKHTYSVLWFRQISLSALGIVFVVILMGRLVRLQVIDNQYLQSQGDARTVRTIALRAERGLIVDRNGEPLAVSTPVKSVWVNPHEITKKDDWHKLAHILEMNPKHLLQKIQQKSDKKFVYLKRHLPPLLGKKVEALNMKGVYLQTEYQRFYPSGEVAAHVIGTTNIDDRGIQGLELAFDEQLTGSSGHHRVLKDARGSQVELHERRRAQSGQTMILSLDSRMQYLAYRELLMAVKKHRAASGSIVILDTTTGEILTMVNYPSYNPNLPPQKVDGRFRNRALTDQFEPGSVLKAFSMINVLASGKFDPYTTVDTSPGWMKVSGKIVRDIRNYGILDVSHVIQKSSNVGIAKLTLSLPAESLYDTLRNVGFGERTDCGFPGESGGYLSKKITNNPLALATLSFGYGIAVTPLQLAQAYAVLANEGKKLPITFLKSKPLSAKQVLDPIAARSVNKMLQLTVADGTAQRARIPGYSVAGKTGTVRKVNQFGYTDDNHMAVFAGFAPATNPRLVMVVIIDELKSDEYYGGQVAAPVFSKVMFNALRLLNVQQESYYLAQK